MQFIWIIHDIYETKVQLAYGGTGSAKPSACKVLTTRLYYVYSTFLWLLKIWIMLFRPDDTSQNVWENPEINIIAGWEFTHCINTLRPRQNGRHFPDDIFKYVFFNENVWLLIKISPKFVPKGPIDNILALVQIMAWQRPGNKPLSDLMMVRLPTYIYVTRPQWVNSLWPSDTIWRQRSGSTLAQVMACCLTAPSLYLNQCWLIISEVQWHSY